MDEHEMTGREPGETQDEPRDASPDESAAMAEAFESNESHERSSETPDMSEAIDLAEASDRPEPHEASEPAPPIPAESPPETPAWQETTPPPETLAPHDTATPPAERESMTDQESDRAETEASAEAAADDGRGTALPGDADDRTPALDLASLHLRLGSLALARSELEMFAGRGVLDATARIDLAEVRWRTGDLVGAGEVAREALAGGGEAVVALVVASEAASALGRPSEARRLAGRALSLNGGPIDPIFAGMPRSSVWPGDPAEPVPLSSTLFPPERSDLAIESDRDEAAAAGDDHRDDETPPVAADASADAGEPGLWDLHEAAALAAGAAQQVPSDLDPSALFDAGRAALETGDRSSAAVHLGLVVRMAPALAPAVLSLIGEPSDSGLQLVQGDAYRAVGHEAEARRCYAAAIASASTPTTPSTVEWFGAPSTAEPRAAAWWLESLDESRPAAAWPPSAPPFVPAPPVPPAAPTEAESPPESAESESDAESTESAESFEPEPSAESAEPEPPAESFEPESAAPESPAESAEPDRATQSSEPDGPTEAFEPSPPDPEPGWRDDEGGWRKEDEEWRSDG